MAKIIATLVNDIKEVLLKPTEATASHLASVGSAVAKSYMKALQRGNLGDVRTPKVLYASEIGNKCPRQIKYKFAYPEAAEPMSASTKFKFLYGDMIEASLIGLAKVAGHSVELEQQFVEYKHNDYTIRGRMDCVIDGHFIDVKSTTSFGFKEFQLDKGHLKFGYGDQLNLYKLANVAPTRIPTKDDTYFLVADKQLGHIALSSNEQPIVKTVEKIATLTTELDNHIDDIPILATVPIGTSGNLALCTECSYCAFKKACHPGVRAFKYSNKVEFLTKVISVPKVPEIAL